jgi:hypothetical protein
MMWVTEGYVDDWGQPGDRSWECECKVRKNPAGDYVLSLVVRTGSHQGGFTPLWDDTEKRCWKGKSLRSLQRQFLQRSASSWHEPEIVRLVHRTLREFKRNVPAWQQEELRLLRGE